MVSIETFFKNGGNETKCLLKSHFECCKSMCLLRKLNFLKGKKNVLQFLFSLPINLRLRPYETPSKQNKYSEKNIL